MIDHEVLIYLDDIIIYTQSEDELWQITFQVMDRLREADFFCKPEKCYFAQKKLDYLGFVVDGLGCTMDPYKIKAIEEWPEPSGSKTQIRRFIGFANFYRKFIKDFAKIARPLTEQMSPKIKEV